MTMSKKCLKGYNSEKVIGKSLNVKAKETILKSDIDFYNAIIAWSRSEHKKSNEGN